MTAILKRVLILIGLMLLPVVAAAQPIYGADPTIWEGEVKSGTVIHKASGMVFPERLGDFARFRIVAFSGADDVAVNYNITRDGKETLVTIYLFKPRGGMIEHHVAGAVMAIGVRSPSAFLWSDGPFTIAAKTPLTAYKGSFKTGIGPNTVMDYLYFVPLGTWTLKIRATLPATRDVAEEQAIDAAVRALPWDSIVAAGGGCTGTACAPRGAVAFNSHMASLGVFRMLAAATPAVPPVYERDGYRLVKFDDRAIPLFVQGYGALSVNGPVYVVETGMGDKRQAVRFFDGLPDEAAFKATVKQVKRSPPQGPMVSPAVAAAALAD